MSARDGAEAAVRRSADDAARDAFFAGLSGAE